MTMKFNFILVERLMNEGKVYIIVGHYGSGKTEFAINFAYERKAMGGNVAIVDLDIVNPYFRIRQKSGELGKAGIEIISSSFGNDWKVDVPSLNRMIHASFTRTDRDHILDVGGNGVGAKILSRFHDYTVDASYEMWFVVNARRYESQTVEQLLQFMEDIETNSRLHITGLINNTHLSRDTAAEDILVGEEAVRMLYHHTGIPCVYTSMAEEHLSWFETFNFSGTRFPMKLHMRPHYL